jgi:diacylglycerol kinase (ATP)
MPLRSNPPTGSSPCLVLFNPQAGRQKKEGLIDSFRSRIKERNREAEFIILSDDRWPGIINKLQNRPDLRVIIVGGDGTLRYALQRFYRAGLKPPVGLVPLGSANLTARSLGIPLNPKRALLKALTGRARPFDLGLVNRERIFFLALVIGQAAEFTIRASRDKKKRFGFGAYAVSMSNLFKKFKESPVILERDEQEIRVAGAHSVLVCNHLNLHGLKPRRRIVHDDGELDLFILAGRRWPHLLRAMVEYFARQSDSRVLQHVRFRRLILKGHDLFDHVHLDGDEIKPGKEILIETIPAGVNFIF